VLTQVRAILWAQWRAQRNFFLRSHKAGVLFTWFSSLLWYGLWVAGAVGAALLTSGRVRPEILEPLLTSALFFIFFFWQLFPVLLASSGAFLDVKRLLVYPIPPGQLFLLEVALRLSTGLEMLLVLLGACAGLLWNPQTPWWTPLPLLVFGAFNLFLASGLKTLLDRLLQRKWVREILVFCFLLILIVPQMLALKGLPAPVVAQLKRAVALTWLFPWKAAGHLASGHAAWGALAVLTAWTAGAYWFARAQFARSLRLEEFSALPSAQAPARRQDGWIETLYRAPALLFPDPLAALMEKELRLLFRASRFRLVFLMACTMGQLLWLPIGMRRGGEDGFVTSNYLTLSMSYALLILSDILLWNVFGMERGAAQAWFVTPVSLRTVLRAKNLVAAFCLLFCLVVITTIVLVLPVQLTLLQFLESAVVLAVMALILMAAGNMASVYYPRAVDPGQTWRNSSGGKVQAFMLLVYPVISIPISMAYVARWALESEAAFFAVLAVDLLIAAVIYWVATDSALEASEVRKEEMTSTLTASQREGPISLS
jgi:ABC-2 type transport system permease protein